MGGEAVYTLVSAVLESAVDLSSARIRLVVNADGFGLSAARTRGILAAHRSGIVTSTSVLGIADDPASIKAELGRAPNLGRASCSPLEDGAPVSKPEAVASLLDEMAGFRRENAKSFSIGPRLPCSPRTSNRIDAQVARLRDLGLVIDHLCARGGVGFLPVVAQAMEKVARHHGIAGCAQPSKADPGLDRRYPAWPGHGRPGRPGLV